VNEVYWTPGMTLEELEKKAIKKALHFFDNNKDRTALSLKIARRTLDNKLQKYDKEEQEEEELQKQNRIKEQQDRLFMRG